MERLLFDSQKEERPKHPRKHANIFEILTFSWLLDLFKIGKQRDLEEKDLYKTLEEHLSSPLGNELENKWNTELAIACKKKRNSSLLRVLIRMFGAKYLMYGIILATDEIVLKMANPLCIGGLLAYFNSDESNKTNKQYAYICAFVLVFNIFISLVLYHSTQIEVLHCSMKIRVACCSVIYRKALRLSTTVLDGTPVGQMINLLSNDVGRFDIALGFLNYLWIGPLQTIVVTVFLWQEIGVSSMVGVASLFVFIPLQGWLGRKMSEYRTKIANITDERIRLMNEIISGIQVIKMYTWEKPFANLIEYIRRKEIRQIRGSSNIRGISSLFAVIQIRFILFITILSYVFLGNYISVKKIYVVTSFYSLLLPTMTIFFCHGLGLLAEVLVSVKRIQHFLLQEEKNNQVQNNVEPINNDQKESNIINEDTKKKITVNSYNSEIVISKVTTKWAIYQPVNCLENINLTIRSGRLVAIIGPVGAGKSSLIQAILGELPLHKGSISTIGVVSYASQEPWLFSGSIQHNILFNLSMDKLRYEQVIKACALENDLEQFQYGDRTIVGEKGVTLSGGQRARINLARAIYKQADIYLLDDPFSAVDTCVGKHLFEKCVKDYLKEKTCILITHQIQFLTKVNEIVLMENGSISAKGSYQKLQSSGFDFTKLLEFSDETKFDRINEQNENNRNFESNSILSIRGSNDSISHLSIDKYNLDGDFPQPNENTEIRSSGRVLKNVYMTYVTAGGSICKIGLLLFVYFLCQILITGSDYWISYWVNKEEYAFRQINISILVNETSAMVNDTFNLIIIPSDDRFTCIMVYSVLIILMIVINIIKSLINVSVCMSASINLHNTMFNTIIRTTMSFFNTNSSGRILNRFSKDIGAIDETLPAVIMTCLQVTMSFLGIVCVVGLVNIYLIIPTCVIGMIFYYFRMFYLPSSRSIKRLEGVTRSPIFAHMNASMQGLTTIRAYKAEKILSDEFDNYQDLHSSAWYLFISSNEAFGCWLDLVCLFYMSIIIFSFLLIDNGTDGSNVGLTITQIMGISGMIQWGIRQSAVLENEMTSVERVLEYSNLPQEATIQLSPNKASPIEWPNKGKIVFQHFSLRYNPHTPLILRNLNFTIQPEEKVGIVGRTGAGKSSIIGALFRLAYNEGEIIIDDREIHELGLQELRSKISIIPQEPILFSGTMRKNLDPFDEYPDHILWSALDDVQLRLAIEKLPGGLNTKMSDGGSNFSIGQRQLVCLARAIIRKNKILVLDEATANVDPQTDTLIQNTIKNKFLTCTVMTIAHRLNTVMDSDKVLVMDSGIMVEFDHPYILLKNRRGFLYKMVEQTGRTTADLLYSIAAKSFMTMGMKIKSQN
ncbi:ABC transporter type 1, transmembrane domain,ABC transporter-like,P-loop containing nucleoside triphosphate [Cinara cedri]|uniref:ABC transporter type 1, transmembrane domain,ABC transporter-like,P-loop containing nucleoside triphosphate n=1 Tax=Cinara cedri TaxID=506608 RepID=A0A5E4MLW1_9HEMI|nr:ABC transporter type 1, transmembrane domain,ABC transporter-like,P-loop containing nucleoside triphosphate [Cinara cedri]